MNFIDTYFKNISYSLDKINKNKLLKIIKVLKKLRNSKSRLFIIGVGGSAGNASHAVNDFRTLLGSTSPEEAAEGTIRKLFATSVGENAVHGSDSDENSVIETRFHFSDREVF